MKRGLDPRQVASLAREAAAGDQGAFRDLVTITNEHLYRFAARVGPGEDDAADIVQESYLRIWRGLPKLTHPKAALAWIFGICRNAATDALRKKRRTRQEVPTEPEKIASVVDDAEPANEGVERREEAVFVTKAVSLVKEKYRVVLLLFYVDEFSTKEIAAALGMPVGTVESRLHRGRLEAAKEMARLRGRTNRRSA